MLVMVQRTMPDPAGRYLGAFPLNIAPQRSLSKHTDITGLVSNGSPFSA